jgi:hypothetical protein
MLWAPYDRQAHELAAAEAEDEGMRLGLKDKREFSARSS